MNETKSLGQIAYEYAWANMPWSHLPPESHRTWNALANTVAAEVRKECAEEMEKLRRHQTATMLANDELSKERDESRAECERLRKELATLTAPPTGGKETGKRTYEAWAKALGIVATWPPAADDFSNTWAEVERAVETPLRVEIAVLKAEIVRLRQAIADMSLHDVPPEHELSAAVEKMEKHEPSKRCGVWNPTSRLRWLKGEFIEGKYRLQQVWTCAGCGEKHWSDVEVV